MAEMKHRRTRAPLGRDPAAAKSAEGGESAECRRPETPSPRSRERRARNSLARPAERDEYLDHLQRLQAEFDNYRKRVRREGDAARLRAAEDVVESLLPVVDNWRRASRRPTSTAGSARGGRRSWSPTSCAPRSRHTASRSWRSRPGTPFDPDVHEAVMAQPSDERGGGHGRQVMERGYLLHGRLLRPAKVIVAR